MAGPPELTTLMHSKLLQEHAHVVTHETTGIFGAPLRWFMAVLLLGLSAKSGLADNNSVTNKSDLSKLELRVGFSEGELDTALERAKRNTNIVEDVRQAQLAGKKNDIAIDGVFKLTEEELRQASTVLSKVEGLKKPIRMRAAVLDYFIIIRIETVNSFRNMEYVYLFRANGRNFRFLGTTMVAF